MHIDYLSAVHKMLALPVERLVGNCNPNNRQTSLSPDSFTSTSISRSSSSPGNASNASSSSPKCHCPKKSLNSPLIGDKDTPECITIKVESPEEDDNYHCSRFPINNRKSGEDPVNRGDNHGVPFNNQIRPSAPDHPGNNAGNNTGNNSDDDDDIDVDGDDDKTKSVSSLNFTGFSSNFGLNLTKDPNKGSGASLKFSIEDILRPDFGLSKFQLLTQHGNHGIRNPGKRSRPQGEAGPSSVSSGDGVRPYKVTKMGGGGRSSVIYASEDSNGSCASKGSGMSRMVGRETEVVDDTKVNPPVPEGPLLWPAWVYCTRYSDRPSSGPRSRRIRKEPREIPEEKRPRTAFTAEQLSKLKKEFDENRYLTEKRRQDLARDLKLHENQIKIWFQNKRAKLKKSTGTKNGLAMQLMAQGLYNHSTVPVDEEDEMMMEMQLMQ